MAYNVSLIVETMVRPEAFPNRYRAIAGLASASSSTYGTFYTRQRSPLPTQLAASDITRPGVSARKSPGASY